MYYIQSVSSISHRPTFRNEGFSASIKPLTENTELVKPDYHEFIEPKMQRRMSSVLKMALCCAKDSLNNAGIEQPGAIIVGTGLGCIEDTEKFLKHTLTTQGLIPPTSFIQSTHNTIAGQLSLILKNNNYNITHTQNSLSFEHALIDAMLCLDEGMQNVLLGTADEYIDFLKMLKFKSYLTSGSSFFVLSNSPVKALAAIEHTHTVTLCEDVDTCIEEFLVNCSLTADQVDLVLFSSLGDKKIGVDFVNAVSIKFDEYSGVYATNSAFAVHWAVDSIQTSGSVKKVLICNMLNPHNIGLTLITAIEAQN